MSGIHDCGICFDPCGQIFSFDTLAQEAGYQLKEKTDEEGKVTSFLEEPMQISTIIDPKDKNKTELQFPFDRLITILTNHGNNKEAVITKCQHVYDAACLGEWLKVFKDKSKSTTCPSCREPLLPPEWTPKKATLKLKHGQELAAFSAATASATNHSGSHTGFSVTSTAHEHGGVTTTTDELDTDLFSQYRTNEDELFNEIVNQQIAQTLLNMTEFSGTSPFVDEPHYFLPGGLDPDLAQALSNTRGHSGTLPPNLPRFGGNRDINGTVMYRRAEGSRLSVNVTPDALTSETSTEPVPSWESVVSQRTSPPARQTMSVRPSSQFPSVNESLRTVPSPFNSVRSIVAEEESYRREQRDLETERYMRSLAQLRAVGLTLSQIYELLGEERSQQPISSSSSSTPSSGSDGMERTTITALDHAVSARVTTAPQSSDPSSSTTGSLGYLNLGERFAQRQAGRTHSLREESVMSGPTDPITGEDLIQLSVRNMRAFAANLSRGVTSLGETRGNAHESDSDTDLMTQTNSSQPSFTTAPVSTPATNPATPQSSPSTVQASQTTATTANRPTSHDPFMVYLPQQHITGSDIHYPTRYPRA